MSTQDPERDFVLRYTYELLLKAWECYQKFGRGALIIPPVVTAAGALASEGVIRIVYAPLRELEEKAARLEGGADFELDRIREYDPARDCVVIFLHRDKQPPRMMTWGLKDSDPGFLGDIYEKYTAHGSRARDN